MTPSIRVLVVDEDRDVRELTSTFLQRADDEFAVDTAESGAEALDHLSAADYDAVVSDLRMPGMDGLELAEAIEERDLDPAFVLFTAADDPGTSEAVDAADVDGFVLKGSGTDHYDDIAATIRETLDR